MVKTIARPENLACSADAGLHRVLTIRDGGESYSDCSVLEVNPLADVPRVSDDG
jgi:hypothetical protein